MKRILSILIFAFLLFIACGPLMQAQKSFEEQNYNNTISICKTAVQEDSTNVKAWVLLHKAYFATGDLDSSLITIQKALVLDPKNISYKQRLYKNYIAIADSQVANDRKHKAVETLELAIDLFPEQIEAIKKTGDIQLERGLHKKATASYLRVVEISGDSTLVSAELQQIDSAKGAADTYLKKGLALLKQNKYDSAVKQFQKAIDEKHDFWEAHYHMHMSKGLKLLRKGSAGKLWDAIGEFGEASALFPKRGEPHYHMGTAYHKKDKKEYANAIESYELCAKVEPEGEYAKKALQKAKELKAHKKKMDEFWGR